jgi:hypothetical protein
LFGNGGDGGNAGLGTPEGNTGTGGSAGKLAGKDGANGRI